MSETARRQSLLIAGAMAAIIVATRFVDARPEEQYLLLLAMPIALVAASHGLRAGLAAGALAIAAFLAFVLVEGHDYASSVYVTRAATFLVVGGLVGGFADRARRAHDDTAARETLLRMAEAAARFGGFEWNIGTDTVRYSPELQRMLGVAGEAEQGRDAALAHIDAEDRERLRDALGRLLRTGDPVSADVRIQREGGHRVLRVRATVELDEHGTPASVRGFAQDVTAEEHSRSRFTGLLEAAPDGIVGVDQDGTVVVANAQAERIFGWDRAELIGRSIEVLLPAAMREAHAEHRRRFGAAPHSRAMGPGLDLRGLRADGEEFPVEVSLSPVHTPEGLLVLAAVRDVTERRAMEGRLRDAHAELELRAERERQALEVNDNIVQGLAIAKYAIDAGADEMTRRAIDETLVRAQAIISGLLGGEEGAPIELGPGDLRRAGSAGFTPDPERSED